MPRFPRSFCFAVLVLTLPTLTGCHSWRTIVGQPVPEVVESHPGKRVRIGLTGGVVFDADSARVRSDSLIAWRHQTGATVTTPDIFPLANVLTIQVRRSNPGRTVLLIGGIVVGVSLVATAVVVSQLDCLGISAC